MQACKCARRHASATRSSDGEHQPPAGRVGVLDIVLPEMIPSAPLPALVANLPAVVVDAEVYERDGTSYTNSRNVAAVFGKDHRNVLRDVDKLISGCSDLSSLLFTEVVEFDSSANRDTRHFEMTRDGLTLLVMGYTGEKAMKFKLAYIERFNAMERALRAPAPALTPINVQAIMSDPIAIGNARTENSASTG